ncbi:hypothetical protein SAMN04488104_101617 [Algoriphagus faecimaris]|uniref:G/U mismatch-specific uracil-DNA glycosylase n=1 Tax=Algoriphagus faecimaris TaxID=686796 RepID=A0A1G6S9F2_9BACT|nr:hypothetical protein [Algoriphagus faecimaris]SDD13570.1 hypothetical protein SAMN04488104_101617 [Algoriphagus faecimaris]
MACEHKFYDYLHLKALYFEPKTLIIGTFNPEWPIDNHAEWFYGRTGNNYFWDVLPRMFNTEGLRHAGPVEWKNFCHQQKVVITDLIASIEDADEHNPHHLEVIGEFMDAEFANVFNEFERTGIIGLLQQHPTISAVYFTRQEGVELFDVEINEVIAYCHQNDIYFSHLLTPSKNARFQMRGWEPQDPNMARTLPNFIYEKWCDNWNQNINQ